MQVKNNSLLIAFLKTAKRLGYSVEGFEDLADALSIEDKHSEDTLSIGYGYPICNSQIPYLFLVVVYYIYLLLFLLLLLFLFLFLVCLTLPLTVRVTVGVTVPVTVPLTVPIVVVVVCRYVAFLFFTFLYFTFLYFTFLYFTFGINVVIYFI